MCFDLKVTEQVRGSDFSKIVIFGVHNLCGVRFLMYKKKKNPESLFTPELLQVSFFCVIHNVTVQRC